MGKGQRSKTVQKKREKIIEDRTFGMKNKKGKKAQKRTAAIRGGIHSQRKRRDASTTGKNGRILSKRELRKRQEEENLLLRPATQKSQKVPPGVDPKTVLCVYFKRGNCQAGKSCKFSHDRNVDRKVKKADVFQDQRDLKEETMEEWDEDTLRSVVNQKQNMPRSKQICHEFLKAVKEKKYGWFWVCPNGGDTCVYTHALPDDYVFEKAETEEVDLKPLEDILEERRRALTGGTPINDTTFAAWKQRKILEKAEKERKELSKRKKGIKAGVVKMTGRELLESDQSSFLDDGADGGDEFDIFEFRRRKAMEELRIDEENLQQANEINAADDDESVQNTSPIRKMGDVEIDISIFDINAILPNLIEEN
eukprot:TRINITY_DN92_c0_g1_i1.p1 TRINITY_DN92_c0_g1~~TRINITY_DN92_c0_g1_i1.p1  ORF type:complete len:366 (-),score=116.98 TRINITY_DN92_c0_g1_i1:87-1184(-)